MSKQNFQKDIRDDWGGGGWIISQRNQEIYQINQENLSMGVSRLKRPIKTPEQWMKHIHIKVGGYETSEC